jgi:hypothetical protein
MSYGRGTIKGKKAKGPMPNGFGKKGDTIFEIEIEPLKEDKETKKKGVGA